MPFGAGSDVARLRAWLPPSIRSDCRSAPVTGTETAALSCSPTGQLDVRYALYKDAPALAASWQRFLDSSGLRGRRGNCAAGEQFEGGWSTSGFFGLTGRASGKLACYVARDGRARLDWTLDGAAIWASVRRSDEDIAAAYQSWRSEDLTPRSPD